MATPCRFFLIAVAFGLNVSISSSALSQDLRVLPGVESVNFPHGYEVVTPGGEVVKTVPGPTRANVSAFADIGGTRLFMSDWSFQRRAKGEDANWIRPLAPPPPRRAPAPPPPAPEAAPGISVLGRIETIRFPSGILIYDNAGRLVRRDEAVREAQVAAYKEIGGQRYWVSDWSWKRFQEQGKAPNWMLAIQGSPADTPAPDPLHPPGGDGGSGEAWSATLGKMIDHRVAGRYAEALALSGKAAEEIRKGSENHRLYCELRILSFLALGRGPEAEAESRRLLKLPLSEGHRGRTQEVECRLLMGRALDLVGKSDEALPHYDFVATHFDHAPYGFVNATHLAVRNAFLRRGDFARFDAFVARHPTESDPAEDQFLLDHFRAGTEPSMTRRELDAKLRSIRAEKYRPVGLLTWVRGMKQGGFTKEARTELGSLRTQFPEDPHALVFARACVLLGDDTTADQLYRKAIGFLESIENDDEGWFEHEGDQEAYFAEITEAYINGGRPEAVVPFLRRRYGDLKNLGPGVPTIVHEALRAGVLFTEDSVLRTAVIERSLEDARARMERIITKFPEKDRLAAAEAFRPLDLPFTLGEPRAAAEAALQFKGIVVDSLADEQDRLSKLPAGAETQRRIAEWEKLRSTLLRQELEGTPPALLEDLEQKITRAEADIFGRAAADSPRFDLDAVTLSGVASAMRPGDALIEYVLYGHLTGLRRTEYRYAAVIIRPGKSPVLVPLGAAEKIDSAIAALAAPLLNSSIPGDDEIAALSESVRVRLWDPLEASLSGADRVFVCPDGAIHRCPFAGLVGSDGKFLSARWNIRHLGSGRDIIPSPDGRRPESAGEFVLVGNPEFSAPVTVAATTTSPSHRGTGAKDISSKIPVPLDELEGTAKEVEQLGQLLRAAGRSVTTLMGAKATEGASRLSAPPAVIHFATHGFFIEGVSLNNPMARSFLTLAGADRTLTAWKSGTVPDPENDGILMAAEVAGFDLRGTLLVVLSACATAQGDEVRGEGVMGLKRAFRQAGAKNTVTTLWNIADEQTVDFMLLFYKKMIGEGMDPGDAHASTQAELLEKFREELGLAPAIYFAAPFVIDVSGVEPG